jgi:hypothetical protein
MRPLSVPSAWLHILHNSRVSTPAEPGLYLGGRPKGPLEVGNATHRREPVKAAGGIADAIPASMGHLKVAVSAASARLC